MVDSPFQLVQAFFHQPYFEDSSDISLEKQCKEDMFNMKPKNSLQVVNPFFLTPKTGSFLDKATDASTPPRVVKPNANGRHTQPHSFLRGFKVAKKH